MAAAVVTVIAVLFFTGQDEALAQANACSPSTVTVDWSERDQLPQSGVRVSQWYSRNWNGGWGPTASTFPHVDAPAGCDPVTWKRMRVVTVARRYLGLGYRHHHLPTWNPSASLTEPTGVGPGLDCSNFTAWVYNYGLGMPFTSNVREQADSPLAPGRALASHESLAPGDLLFVLKQDRSEVSHVSIYVDANTVIDSHSEFGGVTEHARSGWYLTHYSHARRIVE